jgi:starvation-inducible DNA-binding protein
MTTKQERNHVAKSTITRSDRSAGARSPFGEVKANEIQAYGHSRPVPIALGANERNASIDNLNQLLADTMTLRDMYKKHHWQVSGLHFYPLHLLFDKHYEGQAELVDELAERIMTLGGVSVAMGGDAAAMTSIPLPPRGREDATTQINRLLYAHEVVLEEARAMAKEATKNGDDGTNDMLVSNVIRMNELQAWFVYEHVAPQKLGE